MRWMEVAENGELSFRVHLHDRGNQTPGELVCGDLIGNGEQDLAIGSEEDMLWGYETTLPVVLDHLAPNIGLDAPVVLTRQ
jgi:hypothetical protein